MITRMRGSGLDICAAVSGLTYITSRRPDALGWGGRQTTSSSHRTPLTTFFMKIANMAVSEYLFSVCFTIGRYGPSMIALIAMLSEERHSRRISQKQHLGPEDTECYQGTSPQLLSDTSETHLD